MGRRRAGKSRHRDESADGEKRSQDTQKSLHGRPRNRRKQIYSPMGTIASIGIYIIHINITFELQTPGYKYVFITER